MRVWPYTFGCRLHSNLLHLSLRAQSALADPRVQPRAVLVSPSDPQAPGELLPHCLEYLARTGGRTLPRPVGWWNGAAKPAVRLKLRSFATLMEALRPDPEDYLLQLDSDSVMVSMAAVDDLNGSDQAGNNGFSDGDVVVYDHANGPWYHLSGGFNFVKASMAAKIAEAAADDRWVDGIIGELEARGYGINEDVATSLAIITLGGSFQRLDHDLFCWRPVSYFTDRAAFSRAAFVHCAVTYQRVWGQDLGSAKDQFVEALAAAGRDPWTTTNA